MMPASGDNIGMILLVGKILSVVSFLTLVGFYFLAEIVVVVADIARNVHLLVKSSVGSSGH